MASLITLYIMSQYTSSRLKSTTLSHKHTQIKNYRKSIYPFHWSTALRKPFTFFKDWRKSSSAKRLWHGIWRKEDKESMWWRGGHEPIHPVLFPNSFIQNPLCFLFPLKQFSLATTPLFLLLSFPSSSPSDPFPVCSHTDGPSSWAIVLALQ